MASQSTGESRRVVRDRRHWRPSLQLFRDTIVVLVEIADGICLVHIDEPADSDILVLGTKELIPSPQVFLTN